MKETGREPLYGAARRAFQEALLDAFRSWDALEQMAAFGLDENLEAIVPRTDLTTATFKLIEWARSVGRLDDLVAGARAANPGNALLRDFAGFPRTRAPVIRAHDNRGRMLQKLRNRWIDDDLADRLRGAAPIPLGLSALPGAVTRAYEAVHDRAEAEALPPGTAIFDALDVRAGELLLLGAPGAGKTTLLLLLTRDLLDRASESDEAPIPVIFHLSSWTRAVLNSSLHRWLIEELSRAYDAPGEVAEAWIEQNQVLPLLDGLDEVPERERASCVEAINAYHGKRGPPGLVVCCRAAEYEALDVRLKLQGALLVLPLERAQIDAYLTSRRRAARARAASPDPDATRWPEALAQEGSLRELAQSPLWLSLMASTYEGAPPDSAAVSVDDRRRQLLDAYVDRMWQGAGAYPRDRGTRWLSRLAGAAQQSGQQVFFLEHMQPALWLTSSGRRRYAAGVGALVGIVFTLVSGPGAIVFYRSYLPAAGYDIAKAPFLGWVYGLIFGLVPALVFGLAVAGRGQMNPPVPGPLRFMPLALVTGLLAGLGAMALAGLTTAPGDELTPGLLGEGVLAGVVSGGLVGLFPNPERITIVELLQWSWTRLWVGLRYRWATYGMVGLIFAAACGVPTYLSRHTDLWWKVSLFGLLAGAIGAAIGVGVDAGLTTGLVEERARPNEGIFRSVRRATQVGAAVAISMLPISVLVDLLSPLPHVAWTVPTLGPMLGLALGLRYGGLACIQHAVLRLVIGQDDAAPFRYRRFLDFCAQRIFLRKVGGGYVFVDRVVMEYFARLHAGGGAGEDRA